MEIRNKSLYRIILLTALFLFFLNITSYGLTINIVRPFENLTQSDKFDWLNIAFPQMIYDAFFPEYDVAFDKTGRDITIKGRFNSFKGGLVLTIDILWKDGKRDISSLVIGNPNAPLSMRNTLSDFIVQKLSLPEITLPLYPQDALLAYYKGVYYKYIGEETYKDSSYPSQPPWTLTINYLREAVKVAQNFKEAYRELAFAFRETKWYSEEVKAWSLYIAFANEYEKKKVAKYISPAYFNLAYSFYKRGRKDIALSYLTEAVTYDQQNIKAHYWLARTYYDLNRLKDAKKEWDIVIAMDPNYKSAKYFREKVEKALKYGKEAYDYFEKGYLAYKKGDIDLAVDYLNKAMELNYKFMDTYYWLGRIEIERGRYKEALIYLKQGLEVNPSDKKILYLIKLARSKLKK